VINRDCACKLWNYGDSCGVTLRGGYRSPKCIVMRLNATGVSGEEREREREREQEGRGEPRNQRALINHIAKCDPCLPCPGFQDLSIQNVSVRTKSIRARTAARAASESPIIPGHPVADEAQKRQSGRGERHRIRRIKLGHGGRWRGSHVHRLPIRAATWTKLGP